MTETDLTQAAAAGNVSQESENVDSSTKPPATPAAPAQQPTSVDQFIPMLVQLQNISPTITTPPTQAPQSFEEQIQFALIAGAYYLYFWANNQWNSIPVGSRFDYGNGSDGAVTLDGTNTFSFASLSGSTYTLNRDIFATTLILNQSITYKWNGFKIYANVAAIINGVASVKGGNGGNGGPGQTTTTSSSIGTGGTAGTAGVGIPTGTIKQPGNGVAGASGQAGNNGSNNTKNGNNGTNETNCILPNNASNGGASGKGDIDPRSGFTDNSSQAGTGGTATQTTAPSSLEIVRILVNALGAIGCNPIPGSGAGGGGGVGINSSDSDAGGGGGGGSGAPGGIGWIASPSITVGGTGSMTADGGNGGKGGDGGAASGGASNHGGGGGGGGAPGNGGLIVLITPSYTNTGSVTANAGTPGAGGSGNSGGTNGSSGQTAQNGQIVQIVP